MRGIIKSVFYLKKYLLKTVIIPGNPGDPGEPGLPGVPNKYK